MRNPNDRISREMVETLDTVAANLDRLFTAWVQRHNPQHNPDSASTTVGGIALDITLWETGSILIRAPRVIAATERISLTSERLALQSQRALQKEAMALERLTQPALRSGVPKVPKMSPRSLSRTEKQVIREIETLKKTTPKAHDKIIRSVCNSKPLHEREIRNILCHQGFNPPPRPAGIPKDWVVSVSNEGGGIKYTLFTNKKTGIKIPKVEIRVSPGDALSPDPKLRRSFVKHQVKGKYLDKNGKIVSKGSEDAHISFKDYNFELLAKAVPHE